MHYSTCERCAVKRDDCSYLHQASSGPWTIFVVLKAFLFNIIRRRMISCVERRTEFSIHRNMQYYSKLVAYLQFSSSASHEALGALDRRTNGGFGNEVA